MKRMAKFIVIPFLLIASFTSDCGKLFPTEEDDRAASFSGITETDVNGYFVGNIDVNDWSAYAYHNVYFGDGFWFQSSGDSLFFYGDSLQEIVTKELRIYNSGAKSLQLQVDLPAPFSCDMQSIELPAAALQIIHLSYILADTEQVNTGVFKLAVGTKETILINLIGGKTNSSNAGQEQLNLEPSGFYPAIPNPCDSEIWLVFTRTYETDSNIYTFEISNAAGKVIWSYGSVMLYRGNFALRWDLKDAGENRVKPGIYQAKLTFGETSITGDIQVR